MRSNVRVQVALLALLLACAVVTTPASATVVPLGGGWQASWDASYDLDGGVSVEPVGLESGGDVLIIRKIVKFTLPPANGIFPTIPIMFTQIAPGAATHIVIDSEDIENATGVDWTDFHIYLLGGKTVFNPVSTLQSGGPAPIGWELAQFSAVDFNTTLNRMDIWGGVVPAGQFWRPGGTTGPGGSGGGQLWLDVFPSSNPEAFTSFWLKETPTPEPATLCLLALGGVVLFTKRGRRVPA